MWSRFSAWSSIRLRGPSTTASSASTLRRSGHGVQEARLGGAGEQAQVMRRSSGGRAAPAPRGASVEVGRPPGGGVDHVRRPPRRRGRSRTYFTLPPVARGGALDGVAHREISSKPSGWQTVSCMPSLAAISATRGARRAAGPWGGRSTEGQALAPHVAQRLLERERVAPGLAGVVERALHVEDRHRGVLLERDDHLVAALQAPVVVARQGADGDRVGVAREHATASLTCSSAAPRIDGALAQLEVPDVAAGGEVDHLPPSCRRRWRTRRACAARG